MILDEGGEMGKCGRDESYRVKKEQWRERRIMHGKTVLHTIEHNVC
jgi:hypothetical protein